MGRLDSGIWIHRFLGSNFANRSGTVDSAIALYAIARDESNYG